MLYLSVIKYGLYNAFLYRHDYGNVADIGQKHYLANLILLPIENKFKLNFLFTVIGFIPVILLIISFFGLPLDSLCLAHLLF